MELLKTLARKILLDHSKYLKVEEHTVGFPDGRIVPNWPWIIMPDYVVVLAQTTEGKYLCFRQTKYALNDISLALVGGFIEPDESPLVAAQRELIEETGYKAKDWISLGCYRMDGNYGVSNNYLFFAFGAEKVSEPLSDDLEEQQLLLLSRLEIDNALKNCEFKVLAWATTVSLTLLRASENSC